MMNIRMNIYIYVLDLTVVVCVHVLPNKTILQGLGSEVQDTV